jgi:hypothetical protein
LKSKQSDYNVKEAQFSLSQEKRLLCSPIPKDPSLILNGRGLQSTALCTTDKGVGKTSSSARKAYQHGMSAKDTTQTRDAHPRAQDKTGSAPDGTGVEGALEIVRKRAMQRHLLGSKWCYAHTTACQEYNRLFHLGKKVSPPGAWTC